MKPALFAIAALLVCANAGSANASLKTVQKVFIEKMDTGFDADLKVQITRQFKGRVNVVLDRDLADAILVGANSSDDKASAAKSTLRYLGIDAASAGTLTLIDKSGKVVLWADEANDRAPWLSSNGMVPAIRKTLAERLVRKMRRAFDQK